ncbi:MAG: DUF881 domain-containing protein [Coriobacteriia bacterium]|nr:DUF881 domain-containing protein [Coriobacteriia bacterium]
MELIKPFRYRASLVVVFAVLGFMVAVAFNTTTLASAERPTRTGDLAAVVSDMEAQREELVAQVAERRAELDALERSAAEEAGQQESFRIDVQRTHEAAGLTAVTGPGVTVTLGDAEVVPPGDDPNRYIIHDVDITAIVNALLAGGAEAVDVNGQRVVATTAIRCAGTTVLVNQTRLGAPYVVNAIGDAEWLTAALEHDLVAGELLGAYRLQYGLRIKLDKKSSLTVSAFTGGLRPRYAVPMEGE